MCGVGGGFQQTKFFENIELLGAFTRAFALKRFTNIKRPLTAIS